MASPQKILEAIGIFLDKSHKRQRKVPITPDTTTPGPHGQDVYTSPSPHLTGTETPNEFGVPRTLGKGQGDQQLPPRPPPSPIESLDAEINKLAQPSPTPYVVPEADPVRLDAARGIYPPEQLGPKGSIPYTSPPKPGPIVDQLNVLKDPSVPTRPPSSLPKEVVGQRGKQGDARTLEALGSEPYIQSGIPKTNKQLETDERLGRSQSGEVREIQSTRSSGSEQVAPDYRKTAKSTDDVQNQALDHLRDFTIRIRQGRPKSGRTDRFAIDRRTLLDAQGITNRLKARAAGQVKKYQPSEQFDRKASGPEFDKFNKKMQQDMSAMALVAKRDPDIQKALKEANLGLNEKATDSVALDMYYDLQQMGMKPKILPPHVIRDIEHFRLDKAENYNPKVPRSDRTLPEDELKPGTPLGPGEEKPFPAIQPDDPAAQEIPSALQLEFEQLGKKTQRPNVPYTGVKKTGKGVPIRDDPQQSLPLTRVFPEGPRDPKLAPGNIPIENQYQIEGFQLEPAPTSINPIDPLASPVMQERMDAIKEAKGELFKAKVRGVKQEQSILKGDIKKKVGEAKGTSSRVIGGDLPPAAKERTEVPESRLLNPRRPPPDVAKNIRGKVEALKKVREQAKSAKPLPEKKGIVSPDFGIAPSGKKKPETLRAPELYYRGEKRLEEKMNEAAPLVGKKVNVPATRPIPAPDKSRDRIEAIMDRMRSGEATQTDIDAFDRFNIEAEKAVDEAKSLGKPFQHAALPGELDPSDPVMDKILGVMKYQDDMITIKGGGTIPINDVNEETLKKLQRNMDNGNIFIDPKDLQRLD